MEPKGILQFYIFKTVSDDSINLLFSKCCVEFEYFLLKINIYVIHIEVMSKIKMWELQEI
jgi:hypothetical protein